MRAKQVVAVVVLLFIAFLIVFPPLANGGVKIAVSSTASVTAEHLYVTIGEISAHRADALEPSGWLSVSNTSTLVDLAMVNSSETAALGTLSLGQYDTVRVTVTNATLIINNTSKRVQITSSQFTMPVSFLIRFGAQTVIMLKVIAELQETEGTTSLKLTFTAAQSPAS